MLQKRTRNITALGTAPVLAGKLRHALEGMGVPLEDNQRFFSLSYFLLFTKSAKAESWFSTSRPTPTAFLLTAGLGDTSM